MSERKTVIVEKPEIIENLNLLKVLEITDAQPIGLRYGRARKHYKKNILFEKTLSRYPPFMNCCIIKCKNINDCWNVKTQDYKGSILGCELPTRLKKIYLAHTTFKAIPKIFSPIKFSRIQLGYIVLALRYLLKNTHKGKTEILQIIDLLENSRTLFSMYSNRE